MTAALIIVDVQNDFLPGGALAVPEGDKIISGINQIMRKYDWVVATQDWHPANHASFASSHPGKKQSETIMLGKSLQYLWPDHCVQATCGAELSSELQKENLHHVSRKGTLSSVDSYSGFFDNDRLNSTDLNTWLRNKGVSSVDICGLATDYCVKATVLDALMLGYYTKLRINLCRGVNLNAGDDLAAISEMKKAGVEIIGG